MLSLTRLACVGLCHDCNTIRHRGAQNSGNQGGTLRGIRQVSALSRLKDFDLPRVLSPTIAVSSGLDAGLVQELIVIDCPVFNLIAAARCRLPIR